MRLGSFCGQVRWPMERSPANSDSSASSAFEVRNVLPRVVGHRGASRAEKENTIAAFVAAQRMGAHMVELDVRRTSDGAVVVHHDPTIAGLGVIATLRRSELPEHVPDLSAALDCCVGIDVNVEIKSDSDEPDYDPTHRLTMDVIALLTARPDSARFLVSSFDRDVVRMVRERAKSLATGFLFTASLQPAKLLKQCANEGHVAVHPYVKPLTKRFVQQAHDVGLVVNTWTVDDPDRIRQLASWGVDAVITNVPDVALEALTKR